jgi:hypothetical protein
MWGPTRPLSNAIFELLSIAAILGLLLIYVPTSVSLVLIAAALLEATLWFARFETPAARTFAMASVPLVIGAALDGFVLQFVGVLVAWAALVVMVLASRPNSVGSVLTAIAAAFALNEGLSALVITLRGPVIELTRPRTHPWVTDRYGIILLAGVGAALLFAAAAMLRRPADRSLAKWAAALAILAFPATGFSFLVLAIAGAPLGN